MGIFRLPWSGAKDEVAPPPVDGAPPAELGDAVTQIVTARMDLLRATIRGRAGFLRAQATQTDSIDLRRTLTTRAEEDDWLLGQMGD